MIDYKKAELDQLDEIIKLRLDFILHTVLSTTGILCNIIYPKSLYKS